MNTISRWAVALLTVSTVNGFYIPGVTPVSYQFAENVTVKVNSIKSTKTAIPYDYYSLMFCRPAVPVENKGRIKGEVENFGEILWGDRIKASRYAMAMKVNTKCTRLCTSKPKEADKKSRHIRKLKARIDDEYRGHLILDNLPVSEVYIWEGGVAEQFYYRRGYPLGVRGNKTQPSLVNNHLAFTVKYHQPEGDTGFRIVAFNVVAHSVDSAYIEKECRNGNDNWAPDTAPPQTVIDKPMERSTRYIHWSYSVTWEEDKNVAWSSRWDHYLHSAESANPQIHWFSIVNSLLIVLLLSGMVAMILLRALHKDFNQYNNPENDDEAQEETGWKLVHADVFRAPKNHTLLSVWAGNGVQMICMALVTVVFACFGFLSPANRGALIMAMLLLFVVFGIPAGYVTARLAKMFHHQSWQTVGLAAVFVPGKIFGTFFVLNLVLWAKGAASAVPFGVLAMMFALWFCVSTPLVLVGGVIGFHRPALKAPLHVNNIPRTIPPQRWYLEGAVTVILSGAVPFGATFIELYFILSSLWLNRFYYVFGFVAMVLTILIVVCAEMSIVMVYLQLCYEDYNWWWRSFFTAGSSGVYLFLYSVYYLMVYMEMHSFISFILFFSYMGVIAYLFMLFTGTIGFLATFAFVRKIYSDLRVD